MFNPNPNPNREMFIQPLEVLLLSRVLFKQCALLSFSISLHGIQPLEAFVHLSAAISSP
jgi:hypothetical protein